MNEKEASNHLVGLSDEALLALHDKCVYSGNGCSQLDLIGLAHLNNDGRRKILSGDELQGSDSLIILRHIINYGGAAKRDMVEYIMIVGSEI